MFCSRRRVHDDEVRLDALRVERAGSIRLPSPRNRRGDAIPSHDRSTICCPFPAGSAITASRDHPAGAEPLDGDGAVKSPDAG